ncbi:hypothetical protein EVAR_51443_1 [Eumeta japonica]|uniref:Uncharacterized protein n=1 Tax=Eumeta variegata TaxID=151549 RepID=A0A4C1XW64_EUMVA|nr:hypothetical protein EVAR_51443_1 [Eumeta japonica]
MAQSRSPVSINPISSLLNILPIHSQEAGNALVTPLGLRTVAAQDLNLMWARREALCTARPWAVAHTAHALRRLCLRMPLGGGDHLFSYGSPVRLPLESAIKRRSNNKNWNMHT